MLTKKEWYSVPEAAEFLQVSDSRIRQLLTRGQLEGVKFNERAWAISKKVLHAFAKMDRPVGNPHFVKKPE